MFSVLDNIKLNNKTAIVTGGFGNIGMKIVETLLELKCEVIVIDMDGPSVKQKIETFETKFNIKLNKELHFYNTNLASKDSIVELCEIIKGKYNKMDILIHSAALVGTSNLEGWSVPFEDQSMEAFDLCMDINTKAPLLFFQSLIELFKKSECGKIINISSIYGIRGNDFSLYEDTCMESPIAYSISKASLNIMIQYLASLYGKYNICFNNIVLGGIFRGQDEKFIERYNQKTPLGRMGTEDDIKGMISFLSSNLSNYVTGQNLVLDGGITCKF